MTIPTLIADIDSQIDTQYENGMKFWREQYEAGTRMELVLRDKRRKIRHLLPRIASVHNVLTVGCLLSSDFVNAKNDADCELRMHMLWHWSFDPQFHQFHYFEARMANLDEFVAIFLPWQQRWREQMTVVLCTDVGLPTDLVSLVYDYALPLYPLVRESNDRRFVDFEPYNRPPSLSI